MSDQTPQTPPSDSPAQGISKLESLAILLASLTAALSAFAATVIAQRTLSPEENTEFLLFWSLLFGLFGIIAGIQQETTRAVGAAKLQAAAGQSPAQAGARILPLALGLGLGVALLAGLSAFEWAEDQIPSTLWAGVGLILLGSTLYAAHSAMSGAAAGAERWFLFASLGGGEAAWRLVAMVLVALTLGNLLGFEAAVVSASLLWVLLILTLPQARAIAASRADVPAGRFLRNLLLAMGSSAASAVLTVAFPTLLKWSQGEAVSPTDQAALGFLILAISITRSPIMIPLQAFQGVAISAFLKERHRPLAAFSRPAAALLGLGLVGGLAAWLIGPTLFSWIYQREEEAAAAYDLVNQGWVLGSLTFASAIMALLVLSGTAVIALGAHRLYIAGWIVGAMVATGLLFVLPLDLIPRAITALYLGPLLGFATHLAGMVLLASERPRA